MSWVKDLLRFRKNKVLLDRYVAAANRMANDWADGDELVKRGLWRNLHEITNDYDKAYPF